MNADLIARLQNVEKLPVAEKEALKAHLSINEARIIMQKQAECPKRPVPVQFARQLRKCNLSPPPSAFRNWDKMAQWYKNS